MDARFHIEMATVLRRYGYGYGYNNGLAIAIVAFAADPSHTCTRGLCMFPLQSVTIAVSHVFSRAIPLAYVLLHDMENMPVRVRGIRHGNELWREWCTIVRFDSAAVVSLFDQHGVVDCLTHSVACDVGTDLEHLAGVRNLLCSYGHQHCHHALDKSQAWA